MFNALPIITRYWFGATMLVTLSTNFGILSGNHIVFNWTAITTKFELWRLVSPFLFAGSFSFNTLIACYMLVSFSKQYELGGPFNTGAGGGTADYAFCLLFGVMGMLVTYPLLLGFGLALSPVFCINLIYYVLYIWSKKHATSQASLWGFPIAAIYLPFAYLALTVFMGNPYMDMLHGMAIGHLYYFAVEVIPLAYGKDFLHTPNFLIDYFGVGEYTPTPPPPTTSNNNNRFGTVGGGGHNTAGGGGGSNRSSTGGGSHSWGTGGQRLGAN